MSKAESDDNALSFVPGKYTVTAANCDLSRYSGTIHPFRVPFKSFSEHKCQDLWPIVLRLCNLCRNLGHLPFCPLLAALLLSTIHSRLQASNLISASTVHLVRHFQSIEAKSYTDIFVLFPSFLFSSVW